MKLVDIKNLTFEYFRRDDEGNVEEMIEALKEVSFDVHAGEFIAILGRNGSGKSTLAKHINALLLPSEGEVIVDGMDVEEEELRLQIRKTAGMVFQNPDNQIIGNIVEEDVAFGPENLGVPTSDIWNKVDYALDKTDMKEFRTHSPNHLSGGQKQRVAIAGVLAMEPKCIIFDEATAMLDPEGRKQIIKVAKYLQQEKGITIILITHHMDEVLEADRVFVMNKGVLQAQGTPRQIFKDKELLEQCGLSLPPLYRYLYFLLGQGKITDEEADRINTVDELIYVLRNKYGIEGKKADYENGISSYNIEEQGQVSNSASSNALVEGIVLNEVSYLYNQGYANEQIALKNVSVKLGKGEFVAIIGHTGSGKSTLMQHLNGLYKPTSGTVFYNGHDITDSDFEIKQLRQKVGLVFQYPEHQLFGETVEKDVCFGPENMAVPKVEAQKWAYDAIKAVGLPDTIYDVSPLQLSGGQKRKVAIAGILAMHPEYLVLDEPTAGLDPLAADHLLKMLKDLQVKQGITIVLVSHSMEEVAEYAERVIVMDKGEIIADGATAEIFANTKKLRQLGLDVPVGVEIINGLKNEGNENGVKVCQNIDICEQLLQILD